MRAGTSAPFQPARRPQGPLRFGVPAVKCSGEAAWNCPLIPVPSVGVKGPPAGHHDGLPSVGGSRRRCAIHHRNSAPMLVRVVSPVSKNQKTDTGQRGLYAPCARATTVGALRGHPIRADDRTRDVATVAHRTCGRRNLRPGTLRGRKSTPSTVRGGAQAGTKRDSQAPRTIAITGRNRRAGWESVAEPRSRAVPGKGTPA